MVVTTRNASAHQRQLGIGGLLLGMGLGGLLDGIVAHQILQWHHMGTAIGGTGASSLTVASLRDNTFWDGLFHAGTWVLVAAGVVLLWRAVAHGCPATWRSVVGLALAGWGVFDVVEGLVDHEILGIHHVRDDLGGPVSWDIGFLLFGAVLLGIGLALRAADLRAADLRAADLRATDRRAADGRASSERAADRGVAEQRRPTVIDLRDPALRRARRDVRGTPSAQPWRDPTREQHAER